jgi:hypothetical protein
MNLTLRWFSFARLARIMLLILVAGWLSGCANSGQVYGLGAIGQKVEGDANTVSVWNVWSAGDALPLATLHCRKYGKSAFFEKSSGITAYFICEK